MLELKCANHEDCDTLIHTQDKINDSEERFINGYAIEVFCPACQIKMQINVTSEELE